MAKDIEDKLEIQHLAQVYADGVMQRDAELWGSTWAENGSWSLPGMEKPVQGRETLKGFWSQVMAGYPHVLHWVQPGLISVSGDKATARFYVQENIKDAKDNQMRVAGVYDDQLVRENGKWKFAKRDFTVLYRGPTDLSGDFTGYSGKAI
ncbi:MAG: nuclear transport factor 2 family protein [Alphaproteobacteria bacterium]|nr:nuclear transport factor 2 family protein [Alphaproteobacteria bacterium]